MAVCVILPYISFGTEGKASVGVVLIGVSSSPNSPSKGWRKTSFSALEDHALQFHFQVRGGGGQEGWEATVCPLGGVVFTGVGGAFGSMLPDASVRTSNEFPCRSLYSRRRI